MTQSLCCQKSWADCPHATTRPLYRWRGSRTVLFVGCKLGAGANEHLCPMFPTFANKHISDCLDALGDWTERLALFYEADR